jgi:hypothetical protein
MVGSTISRIKAQSTEAAFDAEDGMKQYARAFGACLAIAAALGLAACGSGSSGMTSQPGFTLSSSPGSATVGQGGTATTTITVNPQNGFTGSVALSASGLPTGVSAAFNPTSTSTTSVLTLSAASSTSTGTSSVTVTGTSGGLMPTTPFSLTVAAPSVSVSVTPAIAAVAATTQTQQFTTTVTGNMGNTNVNWSVDSVAGGSTTVGTISSSGLYTPPSTGGSHTVTATSAVLSSASGSATVAVTDLAGVFTYHNDLARDGANTQEYALSTSTVTTNTFGKLFSCSVDGASYTQPLWVPGLSIGGGTHNVIFVATQNDSMFAFDADASPCVTYWQANLLDTAHGGTPGEQPMVWQDVGYCYGDIYPQVGVTGTPVIDPSTNTIYLVSASEIPGANSGNCNLPQGSYFQRLHALDLASGNEQLSPPATIQASVPTTFSSQMQNQRLGLALSNGVVYVGWSAHEDAGPWYGWLIGYSAYNSSTGTGLQQVSVFNSTPNSYGGGLWASGGAPAVDSSGNLYVSTGNGGFDEEPPPPNNDYGDTVVQLTPAAGSTANGTGISIADYFTPEDQCWLQSLDLDLGSGAPILLPDQNTTGLPQHLLVEIGKQGIVYLVNRDNMGNYQVPPPDPNCTNQPPDTNSQIPQTFQGSASGFYGTPAFWQNGLYFAGNTDGGSGDYFKLFSFGPTTEQFTTTPSSTSAHYFNFPGSSPSVSSQGTSNGIVWILDESAYGYANQNAGVNCSTNPQTPPAACFGPALLFAYDATNLGNELWDSTQAANNRDQAGNAVKFVPPTVANGKVYVSTRTEIDVYGLLTSSSAAARAKTNASHPSTNKR